MDRFAVSVTTSLSMEETRDRLHDALKQHGFGVLWELDVSEILAKKGHPVTGRFVVWEVCKPSVAARVLSENPDTVCLLPCKLGAYAQNNRTVVGMIRPTRLAEPYGEGTASIAREVEEELVAVLQQVAASAYPDNGSARKTFRY